MRIASLVRTPNIIALTGLVLLSACGQKETTPTEPIPRVEISVSDSLSDFSAPTTGIAFWSHPNVAFNSLLIHASNGGVASYNIEDGNEVSRISDINALGAAVSYIGVGPTARSLLVVFDRDDKAFKIHTIDDATRLFQPVVGEIPVSGEMRGFCFGRARNASQPSLYVLQKDTMTRFGFEMDANTVTATADPARPSPSDITSCAVDNVDGAVFIARENGAIHRIPEDSSGALFASAKISQVGDISVLLSETETDEVTSVNGQIALLDRETGDLHVFDRETGTALGIVQATSNDENGEAQSIGIATYLGATSANLGGLYRNGALALSIPPATVSADQSTTLQIIPVNGLRNLLGQPSGEPLRPRGAVPQSDETIINVDIEYQPGD